MHWPWKRCVAGANSARGSAVMVLHVPAAEGTLAGVAARRSSVAHHMTPRRPQNLRLRRRRLRVRFRWPWQQLRGVTTAAVPKWPRAPPKGPSAVRTAPPRFSASFSYLAPRVLERARGGFSGM